MANQTVHITANGIGNTHVVIDGNDVTKYLTDIRVEVERNEVPTVILVYACYDQLEIDGEYKVVHVCPKSARNGS